MEQAVDKHKQHQFHHHTREFWSSRIALILAMAGNAIGLGNFLRFPVKAAQNGGGAFMIPYFIALVFLGIPLLWVEWAMGRFGGRYRHGTTPGIFYRMWNNRFIKYVGAIGVVMPVIICIYYNYIESWTLSYSFFSLFNKYTGVTTREGMGTFLASYQGRVPSEYFSNIWTAYAFFVLTLAINVYVLRKGVVKGIEVLAKWGLPLLFFFGVILVIRVFTLGTPDPAYPDRNILNGLAYMWNPDFSRLKDSSCWLAAAGQIFFTLSVGFGAIQTYASYLKEKDDVALSGLSACSLNEFAEVILGGSIAIPVAIAFFGLSETQAIAKGGAFDLGFQALPIVFQKLHFGSIFGFLWFFLLFIAGITSSVALSQPAMAFLQDELRMPLKKAANLVGAVLFIGGTMVVFFLRYGFLDELDFWAGTVGLVAFAFIETVLFAWIFGMDKGWHEINLGADINLSRIFYYIIKYVTPLYLLVLLVTWFCQDGIAVLFMKGVPQENVPYLWGARALMAALLITGFVLIKLAWKQHREAGRLP